MSEYFNRDGESITKQEWGSLHVDKSYRQIAIDKLDNGTNVSTVWLGIPHGYGPSGPIIFKTIVFKKKWKEQEMYCYSTEEEALRHHKHLVDTHYDEQEPVNRWNQVVEEL